jgi:hypothetical protein
VDLTSSTRRLIAWSYAAVLVLLIAGCARPAPTKAAPPKADAATLVAWVRDSCDFLDKNAGIGAIVAIPHFGKLVRTEEIDVMRDLFRYHVASPVLIGWDVSLSWSTTIEAEVPDSVSVVLGDFQRAFGPGHDNIDDDYRLRKGPAPSEPPRRRATYEFSAPGRAKTCSIIADVTGMDTDVRRVVKISVQ